MLIRNVVFDVGNVLVPWDPAGIEATGLGKARVEADGFVPPLRGNPIWLAVNRGEHSLEEAKQRLETMTPDAVVIDLALGDTSGLELVRWLGKRDRVILPSKVRQVDAAIFAAAARRHGGDRDVPPGAGGQCCRVATHDLDDARSAGSQPGNPEAKRR